MFGSPLNNKNKISKQSSLHIQSSSSTSTLNSPSHNSLILNFIKDSEIEIMTNLNQLKIDKLICDGRFSRVSKGTYMNKTVIIKQASERRPKDYLNEIKIFSMLDGCPNIASCWGIVPSKYILILKPFVTDCYFRYIHARKPLNSKRFNEFMAQITSATMFLHQLNICHGDIKPENILLDESDNFYLTDFGLSSYPVQSNKGITGVKGTPEYIAPDMLLQKEYGFLSDIWSLGMVAYEIRSGNLCYYYKRKYEFLQKIKTGNLRISFSKCFTESEANIINHMLQINPEERITINKLYNHFVP